MRTTDEVKISLKVVMGNYHAGRLDELPLPVYLLKSIDEGEMAVRDLPLWAVDRLIALYDAKNEQRVIYSINHRDVHIDVSLEQSMEAVLEDMTALQMIATGDMGYLPREEGKNRFVLQKYTDMRKNEILQLKAITLFSKAIF